jgi:demethylmenaquinone methyltransferase/2-methoxy-6-polyprenyl-1,4-benzoquinol methylase
MAPGMWVLDVATGTGLTATEALAVVGESGRVIGVDPSEGMLRQARPVGHQAVRGLGEALPFRPESFDMISMGYALRHVTDLDVAFADFRRVLKPGGRLIVLEITRPASRIGAWLMKQYMQALVPLLAARAGDRARGRRLMSYYWDTIAGCVPPEAILSALRATGFAGVERRIVHQVFSEYTGHKASAVPA